MSDDQKYGQGGFGPDRPEPPGDATPPATPYPEPAAPGYGEPVYGQPVYGPPVYGQPAYVAQPTNVLAIIALIVAILVFAPAGAVLGHIARRQIRERNEQGDGLALAAIIVGWAITGIYVCVCLGFLGMFGLIGMGASTAG